MHNTELGALSELELVFLLEDGFFIFTNFILIFLISDVASLGCMSFVNTPTDFIAPQRWPVEQTTPVWDKQMNR